MRASQFFASPMDAFPTRLEALETSQTLFRLPKDGWGHAFVYRPDHTPISMGPDGRLGTDDDLDRARCQATQISIVGASTLWLAGFTVFVLIALVLARRRLLDLA